MKGYTQQGKWKPRPDRSLLLPEGEATGILAFNPMQQEGIRQLVGNDRNVITAFMGSGKTVLMKGLSVQDIVTRRRKQIFIVPQNHIAGQFATVHVLDIDGQPYRFDFGANNFGEGKRKTEKLKQWLLMPPPLEMYLLHPGDLEPMIAVCTHSAFIDVWTNLSPEDKKEALLETYFWIDEAHHVDGVYGADDPVPEEKRAEITRVGTELGAFCRTLILEASAGLGLATATFMRGDRRSILHRPGLFRFFEWPLSKHWETLNLRAFRQTYEEYENTPIPNIIANIVRENVPGLMHLVVFPSKNEKWRKSKYEELNMLVEGLKASGIPTNEIREMIDERGRGKRLEELRHHPEKYRVVIVCDIGREAMDVPPCFRIHHTAIERSLTQAVQTAGRLFRSYEGKEDIELRYYLPKLRAGDEQARAKLSLRLNAGLVGMELIDAFLPPLSDILEYPAGPPRQGPTPFWAHFDEEAYTAWEELVIDTDSEPFNEVTVTRMVENFIEDHLLPEHSTPENQKKIADRLMLRLLRGRLQDDITGMDVSWLAEHGFDKIVMQYGLDNRRVFSGDITDPDFKLVRRLLDERRKEMQEWRAHLHRAHDLITRKPRLLEVLMLHDVDLRTPANAEDGAMDVLRWLRDRKTQYHNGELSRQKARDIAQHVPGWTWRYKQSPKTSTPPAIPSAEGHFPVKIQGLKDANTFLND